MRTCRLDALLQIGFEGIQLAGAGRPQPVPGQRAFAAQVLAYRVARDAQLPRDGFDAMALSGQYFDLH